MINLSTQINLIIFSFLFGIICCSIFEILEYFHFRHKIKFLNILIIVIVLTAVYFEAISIICNAILHFYSILSIILGFLTILKIFNLIEKKHKR